MKHALLLFFRPPYPLSGGDKIRMIQMIELLSKKYIIDVAYLYEKEDHEKEILNKLNINAIYSFKLTKLQSFKNVLLSVFRSEPMQVRYFYSTKLKSWMPNNESKYDVLFANTIRMAQYLVDYPKSYKIVDFVDAISMNYQHAYEKSNWGLWKWIYFIDKKRTLLYEKYIYNIFQKSIIISQEDASFLLKGYESIEKAKIKVIPNYVKIPKLKDYKESDYILFVGKMNYEPNENAVIAFINQVFIKLIEVYPSLKFYIVGSFPSRKVLELGNIRNVVVTGFVDDLGKIYEESKLVVAPMISGAGLQNKIIEAMAYKKCVVTTSIGVQGLNNINIESEIVVIDSFVEMESKIKLLLDNQGMRKAIGDNGFDYVKNYFDKDKTFQLVDNFLP